MFAEVAIPLYVHQTFTYALPESFAAQAQPGCRALVPFGKQLLTGYIVDIHTTLEEAGLDAESTEIKAVEELFDTEPLVTRELLELTKWIADYYFAPWGETIKACLPAGINAEAETMLSLTTNAREALSNLPAKPTTKLQALQFIAANLDDNGALNSRLLSKEFDKAKAGALIRELEKSGYIIVTRQMQDAAVKPKKHPAVMLTEATLHRRGAEESQSFAEENLSASSAPPPRLGGEKKAEPKPLNEQQQRVITTLLEAAEPLGLTQLTEAADVSTSVIKTLENAASLKSSYARCGAIRSRILRIYPPMNWS